MYYNLYYKDGLVMSEVCTRKAICDKIGVDSPLTLSYYGFFNPKMEKVKKKNPDILAKIKDYRVEIIDRPKQKKRISYRRYRPLLNPKDKKRAGRPPRKLEYLRENMPKKFIKHGRLSKQEYKEFTEYLTTIEKEKENAHEEIAQSPVNKELP